MSKKKESCMELAGKMFMKTPINQLPKESLDFAKFMCSKIGMCGEVLLTAYAYYCQMVLGLKCEDTQYKIPNNSNNEYTKWFIDRGFNKMQIK